MAQCSVFFFNMPVEVYRFYVFFFFNGFHSPVFLRSSPEISSRGSPHRLVRRMTHRFNAGGERRTKKKGILRSSGDFCGILIFGLAKFW